MLIFVNFISGLSDTAMKRIDSDLQGLIPIDVPIKLDTERSHSIAKKLREFYFNNRPVSEDTKAKYADVCILQFYSLLQLLTVPMYSHLKFQKLNEKLCPIRYCTNIC
jgi:hypothetical protein